MEERKEKAGGREKRVVTGRRGQKTEGGLRVKDRMCER